VMSDAIELEEMLPEEISLPGTVPEPRHEDFEPLSRNNAWMLYASHASSTWNARSYEFAAVREKTAVTCDLADIVPLTDHLYCPSFSRNTFLQLTEV